MNITMKTLTGLIFSALLILTACDPAKQAQRREDKLYDKATASRHLLLRLEPVIRDLWPCANDTAYILKIGRTDSVAVGAILDLQTWNGKANYVDTGNINFFTQGEVNMLYTTHNADSILRAITSKCKDEARIAFNNGYKQALDECKSLKVPMKQTDTLTGIVTDKRLIKSLTDSLNAKDKERAQMQGLYNAISDQAHKAIKWNIILGIAGIVLLIGCIYLMITKIL